MKTRLLVLVVAVSGALAAGLAVTGGAEVGASELGARDQARPTVTIRSSDYGRILFDSRGRALYAFTADPRGRTTCFGDCLVAWPPYIVRGALQAPAGVDRSLLGTIRRPDGRRQLTIAGRPVYYYVGDTAPGVVRCQNVREFGGLWLVVRPSGTLVR
jgi:predicted lipoprotein with Yx(FWY)xxD motif